MEKLCRNAEKDDREITVKVAFGETEICTITVNVSELFQFRFVCLQRVRA